MAEQPVVPPRGPGGGAGNSDAPRTPESKKSASGARGASSITPLEGKTTIDEKVAIECEILCYQALSKIAAAIARQFHHLVRNDKKQISIIVLDEKFKAALELQQAFTIQTDLLARGFEAIQASIEAEAPAKRGEVEEVAVPGMAKLIEPTVAVATGAAKSVLDLLALFRTDVSYSGRSVAIKETPLMLELAQQLRHANPTGKEEKEISFLYPKLLLYRPKAKMQDSAHLLAKTMEEVNSKRDEAESRIQEFASQVASEESKLSDDLKKSTHKNKRGHENSEQKGAEIATRKEKVVEQRMQLERLQARFKAQDSQWKALQDNLSKADAASGIVPLQLIQQAEELIARFSNHEADTYLLWAEVTTAGGSYLIRRNLFRSLLWSDGLRYSGGAVVSFSFFDGNANIVLSGIHRYREPFTRFRAIWWPPKTTGNSF